MTFVREEEAMLDEAEVRTLISRDVVDAEGKSVGYVECVFNDRETGRPEWLGVLTGKLRHHHVLVPVANVHRTNGNVSIPWTKEQVETAPDYGKPERAITEEMEREAYRHYGLEASAV
jgi:sporulation protein YlmC with PRC-barrel domain